MYVAQSRLNVLTTVEQLCKFSLGSKNPEARTHTPP